MGLVHREYSIDNRPEVLSLPSTPRTPQHENSHDSDSKNFQTTADGFNVRSINTKLIKF